MKIKKLSVIIGIVVPLWFGLVSACPIYYKDGGTQERNYILFKVIKWHSLSGKDYVETLVFPKSIFVSVNDIDDRERQDFEKLLNSVSSSVQPLFEENSKSEKLYKEIVERGERNNYFLIAEMLSHKPTAFCLPNTVSPLTAGDIAFLLLTDINCKGKDWEKTLFPAELEERSDFSAALMFDFLHESRENRVLVARSMLEYYVRANDDLRNWFEHLAGKEE